MLPSRGKLSRASNSSWCLDEKCCYNLSLTMKRWEQRSDEQSSVFYGDQYILHKNHANYVSYFVVGHVLSARYGQLKIKGLSADCGKDAP
jgi:hypothetical protein